MKSDRVLQAIRAEDGEHIAFAQPFLRQTRRDAAHRVFILAGGKPSAARSINQRRLVCETSVRVKDEVGQGDFRNLDIRVWPAKDHRLALQRSAMFIAYVVQVEQTHSQKRCAALLTMR